MFYLVKELEYPWINAVEPLHDLEEEGDAQYSPIHEQKMTLSFKVTR